MPLTPDQALSWVNRLYDVVAGRRDEVETFDDYYRGAQPLAMASDTWKKFHRERYSEFADNWCGVISDAPAQRLRVTGVQLDDEDEYSAAERLLWGDWQRADLDRQSAQGFLETLKSRRSFVLVWRGEDGQQVTWEDPGQVAVWHDPETRRRVAAVKAWVEDGVEYATLYTVDEVWKWSRPLDQLDPRFVMPESVRMERRKWEPREVPGEPWPLTHQLGSVPMVEVRNRGPLKGEPLSEIGIVVPMQDAVNLLWAYLFGAADYASLPARVVLGMEAPKIPKRDESGNIVGWITVDQEKLADHRLLFLNQDGKDPKIAQWDAAKLDVFTDVIEVAVGHLAAQTRTPQHYLILGRNANPPSADALKAAEAGLVAKVHEQQLFLGADVREVFRLMAVARGDGALANLVRSSRVVWADAENRSEAQRADAAQKWRAVGLPVQALLERYWDSDPAEVARIMAMAEQEADDPTMARILREFTAGEPVADAAPVE